MSEAVADHALRRRIVIGVLFLSFISSFNQLVVAPVLPTIGAELGDIEDLPWVLTAYLLAGTVVTPLYGRLGDIVGRSAMIWVSIAIFVTGSILCALAPTVLTLALARGVQGLGGGGLVPLTQAAIADVVPPRERGRYQGYFSIVYVASSVAGPLCGGFIAQYLDWQWIFWLNLPLCAVTLAATTRALRALPQRRVEHRLDLPGAGLIALLGLSLMLMLSWGGVRYAWSSPEILGLLAASIALVAAYAAHSRRTEEPIFPLAVLQDRVVAMASLGTFFGAAAYTGLVSYIPLYFQIVLGEQSTVSGAALMVMVLSSSAASAIVGPLISQNRERFLFVAAAAVSVAAIIALALLRTHATPPLVVALMALHSFGLSMTFPLSNISIQNAVAHRHVGVATASMYFTRSISGAGATAFLGAIILASGHAGAIANLKGGARPTFIDPSLADTFAAMLGVVALLTLFSYAALLLMERRPLRTTVS